MDVDDIREPGIVLYPELYTQFDEMSDEEIGSMIRALASYKISGIVENPFTDRLLKMLYANAIQAMDRNRKRYQESRLRRQYGAYVTNTERTSGKGSSLSFEDWMREVFPKMESV